MTIRSQEGTSVEGQAFGNGRFERFAGTISADGQVQLRLSGSGVVLTGQLALPTREIWEHRLLLTYAGGPFDGRSVLFYYSDGD